MRDGRAALLCVVLAACSYDWSPGSAPRDASADGASDGGGGSDALSGTDAPGIDSLAVEAGGDVVDEPPSCAQLEAQVAQAFTAAVACTPTATPPPCKATTTDACGCTVVLAEQGAATGNYQSAVSALKGSSCALGCTGSCGPAPKPGFCIVADASAVTYACSQN
ncbi:MAG TPA: hypothetical protein VIF09_00140 [Polyangiaceae bacterium]|jgi:hypothetical protein